ncbi:MAG: hypothetical protein H6965_07330 [Chromatiaceae bacterium]|nr:hypothetical protein [Chromatiaceae bacterium]
MPQLPFTSLIVWQMKLSGHYPEYVGVSKIAPHLFCIGDHFTSAIEGFMCLSIVQQHLLLPALPVSTPRAGISTGFSVGNGSVQLKHPHLFAPGKC